MRVLVACEFSGVVRRAFREQGHDAYSVDLLDSLDNSPFHIKSDAISVAYGDEGPYAEWDMMIAHPPCTYLANSGVRWLSNKNGIYNEGRYHDMRHAAAFFLDLWDAPILSICIENPVPHKYALLPPYSQTIQPWMFGEDASKRTCLWLKNLPPLKSTDIIKKDRYANQTPSGQNKLGPSKDRALLRSITYEGIAKAMAEQWTSLKSLQ